MIKLALVLPGLESVVSPPPGFLPQYTAPPEQGGGIYFLVTRLSSLGIYIAGVFLAVWLFWAAFEYMTAEGQKEKLHRARNRIIHALVGYVIIMAAFLANAYIRQIYEQKISNVQNVSNPTFPYVTPGP